MKRIFKSLQRVPFSTSVCEDEIERKFRLTPGIRQHLSRLVVSRKLVTEFTDRYFDTSTFSLTRNDCWLRRRDESWELKSPQSAKLNSTNDKQALIGIDFYRESRDWGSIATIAEKIAGVQLTFPFPSHSDETEAWLLEHRVLLFANVRTLRERNTLVLSRGHKVRLDLDTVIFFETVNTTGETPTVLSTYEIGEVELVSAGENMSPPDALKDAFGQLGIGTETVHGKLLEFLSRHRPLHHEALRNSGLLEAKLGPGKG